MANYGLTKPKLNFTKHFLFTYVIRMKLYIVSAQNEYCPSVYIKILFFVNFPYGEENFFL